MSTPSLLDRLHSLFWSTDEETGGGPTQNDLIKLVFDTVRNLGLTLAVGYGAYRLALTAELPENVRSAVFLRGLAYASYAVVWVLFYLCIQFVLNYIAETPSIKKLKYPFFWLIALLLPLLLVMAAVGISLLFTRT